MSVMVFIEQHNAKIANVSLELICKGTQLASHFDSTVTAVAPGYGIKEELHKLGKYGCQKVFYYEDERLARFTSLAYAKAVAQAIRKHNPRIVLFGATTMGRDIAPRVASELKCGLTADCTGLDIGDYASGGEVFKNILKQIRPAFGGNIIATIVSPGSIPSMATVREGVMGMSQSIQDRQAEIIHEQIVFSSLDWATKIIKVVNEEKRVNLKPAHIIVSAGMGAGSKTSLALVKELAGVLGGELGSSRAMVDGGFLHKDHQVGQTGVTVRPNLYIACGISGQIQHRAGMSESKRIVAINTDPDAPIFKIAHYGIVGDLNDIIPMMIKAYKS